MNLLVKQSYQKNILREVKTTRSRFLSIFGIVLLGVAMLTGLMSVAPDMRAAGDSYFRASNLCDIRVLSTLGLTEKDLYAIRRVEGVENVVAAKTMDFEINTEAGDTLVMRAHSLPADGTADGPEDINRLELKEGRMPSASGECAVQPLGFFAGIDLGAKVTLVEEQDLRCTTYTVVGIVQSPMNFSIDAETSTAGDGALDFVAYLPESEFTSDVLTVCYITVTGADEQNTYSEAYDAVVKPVQERLEQIAPGRVAARRSQIVQQAQAELDEAKAEYAEKRAEAEQQIAEAEAELKDAEQQLKDAKKQLESGERQYENGKKQLAEQRENLPENLQNGAQQILVSEQAVLEFEQQQQTLTLAAYMLDLAGPLLDYAQQSLDLAAQQLEEMRADPEADPQRIEQAQLAYNSALQSYNQIKTQVDGYQAQLDAAKQQLAAQGLITSADISNQELVEQSAQALQKMKLALLEGQLAISTAYGELARAEQLLEDSRAQLDQGWLEYEEGTAQLEEGWATFEKEKADAMRQLEEAEDQINDAQAQIDDIAAGEWYVLNRDAIVCYATFEQNIDRIGDIAKVFPVFFFLVAALVALTTMTRMVEENRQQIGAFKALGYSEMAITAKYLIYALAASLTGALAGMAVGFTCFPAIIWFAYSIMYVVPTFRLIVYPHLVAISLVASVAVVSAATMNACHATLAEKPATLMLPKAPPAGKRIFLERIPFLWNRMSFSYKVTARNLLRYKKRFFMTVLGVAGCTALLVVGFGLQDSIMEVVDVQYERLNHYDMIISFSNEKALTETRGLGEDVAASAQVEYSAVYHSKTVTISNRNAQEGSTTLTVCREGQDISKYFTFQTRVGQKPIAYGAGSVLLTEKSAELLEVNVGDTIWLHADDGTRVPLQLTGITENYLSSRLFLSQDVYEDVLGAAPAWNTILAKTTCGEDEAAGNALVAQFLDHNYVTNVSLTRDVNATFTNVISCINYVVLLIIVCAAALAALVLYNLININIAERKKELATIKVLGFFDREVNNYIFREIYLLSLIGALAGLALGVPLHQFIVRTVEIDQMMFIRSIENTSYLYSVALTMVFTFGVSLFMRRFVNRISMVESMKAPE